jgi:hypothetical protein
MEYNSPDVCLKISNQIQTVSNFEMKHEYTPLRKKEQRLFTICLNCKVSPKTRRNGLIFQPIGGTVIKTVKRGFQSLFN